MIGRRWAVTLGAVAALFTATAARADGIPWRSSPQDALAEAARTNRLVMVDFSDEDCEWCDRMDNETLSNAEVIETCERVIPVRVDVNQSPELARRYAIEGVPSFIFLEGNGDEVSRIEGYMPPPAFIERVSEVLDEQQRVVDLRQRVVAEPKDNAAKADLARIYINRRQGDNAAPLIDTLAALPRDEAPKDMAEMILGTAVAYGSRGNNDRALIYLDRVIKGYPDTEEAEWAGFFTGLALGLKGDRDGAIRQLEQVIRTAKSEVVRARAQTLLERFKESPPVPTL